MQPASLKHMICSMLNIAAFRYFDKHVQHKLRTDISLLTTAVNKNTCFELMFIVNLIEKRSVQSGKNN